MPISHNVLYFGMRVGRIAMVDKALQLFYKLTYCFNSSLGRRATNASPRRKLDGLIGEFRIISLRYSNFYCLVCEGLLAEYFRRKAVV